MQLHIRFIQQAKMHRQLTAVQDINSGTAYSYERILIASLILKNKLATVPGHYIGVMIPTTAGCHITILATLMSGKVPAMINYSTGAITNCEYAREKCALEYIITSKKLCQKLQIEDKPYFIYIEDILKQISSIDKLKAAVLSKMPVSVISKAVSNGSFDDNCVILFTSGSEKEPKAVQLTHRNIWHNASLLPGYLEMLDHETFGGTLPLFHVFGLTVTFWMPLLNGFTVVAFPNPLDYKTIVESIKKHKITVLVGTPTFFNGYLKKAVKGDFDSVRIAITGADKLPDKLRKNYLEKHDVKVLEGYGTTETSPVVSVNNFQFCKDGSIGKAVPGARVKVIDRNTGEELPAGEIGKLMVKGDLVMKGYLGNEEETSLHIRNGWYDTGDMALIDNEGFIFHKGRLRRFIKVGGEMVSLVRTEETLCKYLDDDTNCCVVGVPDDRKGFHVVAAIDRNDINFKELNHKLKKDLPPIAIPKEYYFIEDIPLMGSGKVDFRTVEEICRKKSHKRK